MKNDHDKQDDQFSGQDEAPAQQSGGGALEVPPLEVVENLRKERDDLLARLQRVSADYLNYQKRVHRDSQEAHGRGVAEVAKAMIDTLDDLERAIEHGRANHPPDDPLLVGTELVHANALAKLKQFGIVPMSTEGMAFDPRIHEALMHQPTDQAPPMTVLKEVQKGYTFHHLLLRPAKVIVAAAPAGEEPSGERAE
jgi:molecular chaperone GrpE